MKNIRVNLFGVSQTEFAKIAGTSQATVNAWEKPTGRYPNFPQLKRIRDEAIRRKLKWRDAELWAEEFAEPPEV